MKSGSPFIYCIIRRITANIDFQKMNFPEECKVSLHEEPQLAGAREPCTPFFGQTLSENLYNPIERCWGILENHWNGTKLINAETMPGWAGSMTWKGLSPVIKVSKRIYDKGISLTKSAMRSVEKFLVRNPLLPKWDILVNPETGV
jgi:hypothetical protein